MLLQGTRGHDFQIFLANGESTAWVLLWKTRSRPSGVRVCAVSQFAAFDPREWTMVVFWKEDSGRQLRLITPENVGRDETSSPSPPRFTFFDDPDVPLRLDFHQDCLQLLHLAGGRGRARAENVSRERSRPRSQSQ